MFVFLIQKSIQGLLWSRCSFHCSIICQFLLILFQDGKVTNIDMVDERLRNLEIPENFLDHIYVGRCADPEKVCSVHAGDITDVNIWNRALSLQEMIEWTNCQ